MRPRLLALAIALHGLAHAAVGVWATPRASAWVVTPLWLVAMCGYLIVASGIAGLDRARPHVEALVVVATVASAALLRLAGIGGWSIVGLLAGVALCVMVRWWVRCTHPEIHTPTFRTGDVDVIAERASGRDRLAAGLAYLWIAATGALILVRPWMQEGGSTLGASARRDAPRVEARAPTWRDIPRTTVAFYLVDPARFVAAGATRVGIAPPAARSRGGPP